ncbi:flagellar hook-associated protein FlgK [Bradyrhizobium liaoningense]|uniref:flagellar hook-associated protein FlgK n=1 Tax=Bradyrhizobium liaoningense TaxID=43992 RepID=UPI001BADAADD|nr:flagellar hook-associated protein FlgK [Bradyrhizobium liaoningense]MBR0856959.1 flagellar hook-associated protein FlgK [Bradyrhizobium liaoningense]
MLTNAFNTASAGLQATQIAIGIVSQNVGNAGTAGYVKRTVVAVPSGAANSGVAVSTVSRTFDDAAWKQLRLETSRAAYATTMAGALAQVDRQYGKPGDATALDARLNAFTQTLQGLASNPASAAIRSTVLNAASGLTHQIRGIANNVQGLRTGLENRLTSEVATASSLLSSIAELNVKATTTFDATARAGILDQRDQQITQLSSYLDVTYMAQRDGSATLMTSSGVVLVDHGEATTLSFDGRGTLSSASAFSTEPSKRGVGTITATIPGGSRIDLGSRGALRSGSMAAALELRDIVLPQAQCRLDDLALGLAQSLTDKTTTATQAGSGFELKLKELANVKPGNLVTISIRTGTAECNVTLVASNLASRPVDPSQTIDSNASSQTFTIPPPPATALDFANAISSALSAVAPGLTATSATAGTVTISGAGVQGVTATITQPKTASDFSEAYPQLPLFVDGAGNMLVSGVLDGAPQRVGLAQRLTVNAALTGNSSPLAAIGTAATGGSRPQFLYDALTGAKQTFSSASGIGGGQASYSTTVISFAHDVVAAEGAAAASAKAMEERQNVALTTAQGWFSKGAGVNVDEEMSNLIALQTAYAANARVLTAVREMLDTLLRA